MNLSALPSDIVKNPMVETETPQAQDRVRSTGSTLESVIVKLNPSTNDWSAYDKHRLAAQQSLIHIAQTNDFYKNLTFEFDQMKGKQESFDQFFGTDFCRQTNQFIEISSRSITGAEGYSYAFGTAPYGVQTSTELFQELNDCLFGGISDENIENLEIFSWVEQPWSSFFDAGLIWWGVFIFTIYNKKTGAMCCVAASATD